MSLYFYSLELALEGINPYTNIALFLIADEENS